MGAAGMPVERSKDFKNSSLRLAAPAAAPSAWAWSLVFAAGRGQRVPARARPQDPRATPPTSSSPGSQSPAGHRLHQPAQHPAAWRSCLYVGRRPCWPTCRPTSWPASCSARCTACAPTVEDKLNRLPLSYVDRQPRGDLLSRVTNDIDNVAQSLQQTLSQMLTSTLTIVGVLIMMFTISPLLAADRADHHPGVAAAPSSSSPAGPRRASSTSGRHTGTLNAQVEEAFTGHALVKVFGRQRDVEAPLQREERGALRGQLRRPVHLRHHPAGDDVPRQPELRGHRRDRRPAGGRRAR